MTVQRFGAAAAAGLLVAVAGASADTVFRGFDLNPGPGVPPPPFPNSETARDAFTTVAGTLGTVSTQDFEGFSPGAPPAAFGVGTVTATFTNLAAIAASLNNAPSSDAFGVSGSNYIYTEAADGEGYWRLDFDTPMFAAAFMHTDAADWLGTTGVPSPQVVLDAGLASERVFDLLGVDPATIASGSVGFFGVTTEAPFSTMTVRRPVGGGQTDALGLDDVMVAVPAPSAGVLAGFAAVAASRRRRRN